MDPLEYPRLKELGKVHITHPKSGSADIVVDRGEVEQIDNQKDYTDTLRVEIAALKAEIDARELLIADIEAAH